MQDTNSRSLNEDEQKELSIEKFGLTVTKIRITLNIMILTFIYIYIYIYVYIACNRSYVQATESISINEVMNQYLIYDMQF